MPTTTTLAAKVAAKFDLPAQEVERALQMREEARRLWQEKKRSTITAHAMGQPGLLLPEQARQRAAA